MSAVPSSGLTRTSSSALVGSPSVRRVANKAAPPSSPAAGGAPASVVPPASIAAPESVSSPMAARKSVTNPLTPAAIAAAAAPPQASQLPPPPVLPAAPQGKAAVALYNFTGDVNLGQLNLVKNATLFVISEHPGGWSMVDVGGAKGYVPSNYIKLV